MKLIQSCLALAALVALSTSGAAQIIQLTAVLNGDQANAGSGSGSPGIGSANMVFDSGTDSLSWTVTWSGLIGTPTAMHFHGPALPSQNAGVQVGVGVAGPPVNGNQVLSAGQAADLLAGLFYLNLHTTTSPGGEIRGRVVIAPAGTSHCSGDGGNQMGCTDCPCMNNAPSGTVGGCLNSAGTSASLDVSGDPSVSLPPNVNTDLRFSLSGAPPNAFCILNSGDAVAPGNPANPCFGFNSGAQAAPFDGLRCAIMNTRRHGGRSADANGRVGAINSPWGGEGGPPVGIAVAGGGFLTGQTRYFQVINRDDPLVVCMRGLNTSQAREVTFTP